jgi:MYXO-CTERM domain-containing protein
VTQPATRTYEDSKPTTGIDILTVAQALLTAVQTFYAQNGVELPARQAIVAGEPSVVAWDCEQLIVSVASIGWGRSVDATQLSPTFGKAASVNAMRHVEINVALVRCTPTIKDGGASPILPSLDELNAAGEQYLIDYGMLSQCLVNFVAFHNPAIPPGCNCQAGAVQPAGPEGGLVALSVGLIITAASLLPEPIPTIPSGHP